MRVLLVSTYELGHQPLHLASPAGVLVRAGHDVECIDLSVQETSEAQWGLAEAVAFSVPMHTAMRLAIPVAEQVRRSYPDVPICFYGLYAHLGRELVEAGLADAVISGEYETALVEWVEGEPGRGTTGAVRVELGRSSFGLPARHLLPPLDRYARLAIGTTEHLAGYVEASHGCAHRCRHCPVPVVYDGRTRIVSQDSVLADVAQLVAAGARHITFGDPDFLNGPHHSLRVAAAVHAAWPDLTFDVTAKVEHVLDHADIWPALARYGCLFVVCALESTNDTILARLDKGHTVAQAVRAVALLRAQGIHVRPSWLPFTPWTTVADVAHLIEWVAEHDLVANTDPVQLSIRLLIPQGSLVLKDPAVGDWLGPYDDARLGYEWKSIDPDADRLQAKISAIVESSPDPDQDEPSQFHRIAAVVGEALGQPLDASVTAAADRAQHREVPRLTEAWFCCAEPTSDQFSRSALLSI